MKKNLILILALLFSFSTSVLYFIEKVEFFKNKFHLDSKTSITSLTPSSYVDVIKKTQSSVVAIKVIKLMAVPLLPTGASRIDDFDVDEVTPPSMKQRKKKIQGGGSGFVISADGLIVTNYHVIEDAQTIKVTFLDEEVYDAKLVGQDPLTDLALIKIEPKGKLVPLNFRSSATLELGEKVVLIGNLLQLEGTVTSGIISNLGRSINASPVNFIQTDAAMNFGSSGGPMLDLQGNVVGINTSGSGLGASFAIPSDTVISVTDQIKEGREIKRSKIGVLVQPLNDEILEAVGKKDKYGVMIVDVEENSDAMKKGILKGDIIDEVNGVKIKNFTELSLMITNAKPGKEVQMKIFRYGQHLDKSIMLQEKEGSFLKKLIARKELNNIEYIANIGIKNISSQIRKFFRINPDVQGVIVFDIKNDRTLEQDVLQIGDVVVQVNQDKVSTVDQFNLAIKKIKSKNVIFFIIRDGMPMLQAISLN